MERKTVLPRWGSYDRLTRARTLTPSVATPPSPEIKMIEQEIEYLKDVAIRQNRVLEGLGDRLLMPQRQISGSTKPRDIPILELTQLQGINATTQLQIFFELVEQCSEDEMRRLQVAKSRVSSELAALIHNQQSKHNCNTWEELKNILRNEFATDVNFDRAWQEIDSTKYDWIESPQAFVNKFICQYALLETRFSREKLPNRDKMIKRKIWQGLTQEAKSKLEGFLDEDYPLTKFIERVEHERQWLEATRASSSLYSVTNKNRLFKSNELAQSNSLTTKEPAKPSEQSELEQLRKQIKELTEQVGKLQPSGPPSRSGKYCAYCQTTTHNLRECWRKPSRGRCFDCKREGCWRGKRECTGPSSSQI